MSGAPKIALVAFAGIVACRVLRVFVLAVSARRMIRRTFQASGITVIGIKSFQGFMEFGSVGAAFRHTAYQVAVRDEAAGDAEYVCVVRYVPFLGLARSCEILWWGNGQMKS